MPQQPLDTPIIQKPTPVVADEMLVETTDSNKALYDRMLKYGEYHPDRQRYPTYRFLKSQPTAYGQMQYFWGNDFTGQDAYNGTKKYALDANNFPIFTRSYRVLRQDYFFSGPLVKLLPFTGIVAVEVTNGGSGFTKDFPITFTSGTGAGGAATGIVDMATGKVVFITLTNVGSGYATAPTVVFTAGDGTGAAATAVIQPPTALLVEEVHSKLPEDDPYQSLYDRVTRTWETLPGPILHGSHVDELTKVKTDYFNQIVASGAVTGGVTGAGVITLAIANGGTGFTGNPTLTFSAPPSGVTATGTATFAAASPAGKLASITVVNPGSGFTSVPTITITDGGPGSGATAVATLVGTTLASVLVTAGGSGYTDAPAVVVTDAGTGLGAVAQAFLTPAAADSITVDTGGSGYTAATVSFTGGGGTGLAATVHLTGNVITSITIDTAGSGYTSAPTAVINGDGTGGTAHVNLVATSVASVAITSTGNLYQNPSVAFSGGGGSGATANALLSPTSISSIALTAVGSGYTSPVVGISGGGGSAATATAAIATGSVFSVTITNAGSGYITNPTVTVSGGGGTGASVLATIGGLTWVEVEPITSVKDGVKTTTVDTSSFPATQTFPMSYRVDHGSNSVASLVVATAGSSIDVGMQEFGTDFGNGPALVYRDEMYMTDAQFMAYIAAAFSDTGYTRTETLVYQAAGTSGGGGTFAKVWTFRPTPRKIGTTAGVLELSDQQKPYGYRKVTVVRYTGP